MAGKLIEALKESAGLDFQGKSKPGEAKASKARVTADVRNVESTPQVENLALLPSSSVLVPLGFVSMKIADQTAWVMVDSGSMINIIPAQLANAACLTLKKSTVSIRTMGRPFLFAFNAVLNFSPTRREEVLQVQDAEGNQFETTICQPQSGKWQTAAEEEERCLRCTEPPAEDF
ncbi:hypothetical protein Pst134EB_030118 [Puccinia striiformis f. sp. tritici]|nr:hypothetical protein Pst134EB_030118 [Puccinia striiformis f. sp. tritici]